ncbi:pathogenesis-related homeodomain protein isoform X2 [Diospyros lotus]|uniref:pathogenesis-related homeodomain protein isoform X2 n=1 Tax=Diospyros lotus TaxID=55363 RepID=UPI00225BA25C|nr:pathogenesis-related homeodomain protein isoform X2 [Diospyros lotus]
MRGGKTIDQKLGQQSTPQQLKNGIKVSANRRQRPKFKPHGNTIGSAVLRRKVVKSIRQGKGKDSSSRNVTSKTVVDKVKSFKKQHLSGQQGAILSCTSSKGIGKLDTGCDKPKNLTKRRKRRGQKNKSELDEAPRLQRRTRYLLIKMKLEQNLIDAYSGEGWKGQSREKIKPERELERAKKQIWMCKLGIRDAIRQLDLLSSVGCIEDSAIAPDGSVYHEHIVCAKCKLREAFPDNDIILCDGTCNCAFHQKCLDPPLLTENRDQGWFCKFCECKMEILEAMNAHLGTQFSPDSNWQDIFKEEAALPDGGSALLDLEQEWPSDDSGDDDYDPEKVEHSCSHSGAGSDFEALDDASSSRSSCSLEDEFFTESGSPADRSQDGCDTSFKSSIGIDLDETTDFEILSGPRQRKTVDYKKLYDEMFGKDAPVTEQISDDEDWGPAKRKRREKESDAASTLMTLSESEKKFPSMNTAEGEGELRHCGKTKRPFSRIPPNAVEKLRVAFSESELPSRDAKEHLAKQLGLESEKVSKWFKNARYLALKARKAENGSQECDESRSKVEEEKTGDPVASKTASSSTAANSQIANKSLDSSLMQNQHKVSSHSNNKADVGFGDDVSLKHLKASVKKNKKVNIKAGSRRVEEEAEAELERLFKAEGKIEHLQKVLKGLPTGKANTRGDASSNSRDCPNHIVYVPVAELREKSYRFG